MNIEHSVTLYTEINSKSIKELDVRPETIRRNQKKTELS